MRKRIIHGVAGTLILIGLTLGLTVNEYWFILTGFVGLNLFQNAFTNWCLLENILISMNVKD
ncbi:MAG: sulfurtransferase [Crocinitomicaceae bacterium]|nr:sulfurtransferase [Crocinitomicaceae bacterium]